MIFKKTKQRPKFINLLQISMPVTAVSSILHRITGLILCLILPVIIYWLGLSLQSKQGYEQAILLLQSSAGKILIIISLTSVFYHLLAGIRFLLIDLDIAHNLSAARWTARFVISASIIVLALLLTGVISI